MIQYAKPQKNIFQNNFLLLSFLINKNRYEIEITNTHFIPKGAYENTDMPPKMMDKITVTKLFF